MEPLAAAQDIDTAARVYETPRHAVTLNAINRCARRVWLRHAESTHARRAASAREAQRTVAANRGLLYRLEAIRSTIADERLVHEAVARERLAAISVFPPPAARPPHARAAPATSRSEGAAAAPSAESLTRLRELRELLAIADVCMKFPLPPRPTC